jgi:chromosome segregation ATPase
MSDAADRMGPIIEAKNAEIRGLIEERRQLSNALEDAEVKLKLCQRGFAAARRNTERLVAVCADREERLAAIEKQAKDLRASLAISDKLLRDTEQWFTDNRAALAAAGLMSKPQR